MPQTRDAGPLYGQCLRRHLQVRQRGGRQRAGPLFGLLTEQVRSAEAAADRRAGRRHVPAGFAE